MLDKPGSMKRNLRQLFKEVVARALSADGRRGCFVGNSMSELAGRCKPTANRTCNSVASAEKMFRRALERGREQGEFPGVHEPRAVARFLYSSLQGLLLMAKATRDRKLLNDVVKVTLSGWD